MSAPRIKDGYVVIIHGRNEIEIRTGSWSGPIVHLVDDQQTGVLPDIVSLLDGTRSTEQIIRVVGDKYEPLVLGLLEDLAARGVVDRDLPPTESPIRSFYSLYDPDADQIIDAIKRARICVIGAGLIGCRVIANLAALGVRAIRVVDSQKVNEAHIQLSPLLASCKVGDPLGQTAVKLVGKIASNVETDWVDAPIESRSDDLTKIMQGYDLILACTDYPTPSLWTELNKAALVAHQMWTIATLDGLDGQVGPSFKPFETACYRCLELRLGSHAADYERYLAYTERLKLGDGVLRKGYVGLPGFADTVAGLLIADIPNLLNTGTGFTVGKLAIFHFPLLEFQTHRVLKLPRCPECGKTARGWPTLAPYTSLSNILEDFWNENRGKE